MKDILKRPLTALIETIQNGRFLKGVFLAMLALSVGTVAQDLNEMIANAPGGNPGLQRLEPAPFDLPKPGDQTRPYLPKTMPLGPSRRKPQLPGYFGPLDSSVMSGPMIFSLGGDGKASGIGTILPGTADRLEEFLKQHDREIGELHLHSPGGSVSDALAMGRMIRAEGISTRVPSNAYCASSCPLLLASGLYRSAGENTFVGVHQIYTAASTTGSLQRGMADAQSVSALCQQLLVDMGVDLQVWVKAMATPPAQLYLFTADELSRFKLANAPKRTARPKPRPIARVENG